mgnify:FL=1
MPQLLPTLKGQLKQLKKDKEDNMSTTSDLIEKQKAKAKSKKNEKKGN